MATILAYWSNKILANLILVISFLLVSNFSFAAEFSDDFENTNVNPVATFDLSGNPVPSIGITATLEGGTAFTIGNGLLYHSGSKSWMVEPAGAVNIRGPHPGTGTLTFSVPMSRISFWVRGDPGNTSMVTLKDVDGNMAENSAITAVVSNPWTEVDFTMTAGSPALKSIVIDASGTGMAALDDLGGTSADISTGGDTNTGGGDTSSSSSSGGSISIYLLFVMAMIGFLSRRNSLANYF